MMRANCGALVSVQAHGSKARLSPASWLQKCATAVGRAVSPHSQNKLWRHYAKDELPSPARRRWKMAITCKWFWMRRADRMRVVAGKQWIRKAVKIEK